MIAYNFSAQNRAVTLNDYKSLIETMPSTYGAPAKVNVMEENNKIRIKLLSYDERGNLTDTVSNTLKNNILSYLSEYRMINDYVTIGSAQVIDIAIDTSVVLDASQNQGVVITNIIDKISTFFSPAIRGMGQNIVLSELYRIIQNENGVLSVNDILVFGRVGGQYSSAQTSMPYSDSETKKISLVDNTIFAEPNQIYQIRFPNRDITVRTKNYQSIILT
jgi:hypothetical protein